MYLAIASKVAQKSIRQQEQRSPLPLLLFLAGCFEVCLLFLLALSPLPGLHLSHTPLQQWSWTLLPSQLLTSVVKELAEPGQRHLASYWLGGVFLVLLATYAAAISLIWPRRGQMPVQRGRLGLFFLLGTTAIFGITLLLQPLLFSDDVFTYIFSGRILSIYGADPLNTAPIQFPADPYYMYVLSGRALPNIFGPLWLCIASFLAWLGTASGSTQLTLLLFKGFALLMHLLSCYLCWLILSKVAPGRRVLGTLLYAWNPLAVIELAGGGHNEGLLICLLLLATWLFVHKQRSYQIAALLVFGLAASTNFLALLVAPLFLWFSVRRETPFSRALWKACSQGALILLPAVLISLPFWRGATTFFAITSAIDMNHFVHSPTGTLVIPVRTLFEFVAEQGHFPAFLQPAVAADVTLRASASFIFTIIYANHFAHVRSAPTRSLLPQTGSQPMSSLLQPGLATFFNSCSRTVFWYLVLVSGWFWPWYLLWLLWTVVLSDFDAFTSALLVLSGTALFIYPFVGFSRGPLATYQSALIFGIPLVYLFIVNSVQRYVERTRKKHERRGQTTQD
jgi:hypothetical protein